MFQCFNVSIILLHKYMHYAHYKIGLSNESSTYY